MLGRLENDPRVHPGPEPVSPVLTLGTPRAATPLPSTQVRVVAEAHPSRLGRLGNDPRGATASPEEGSIEEAV